MPRGPALERSMTIAGVFPVSLLSGTGLLVGAMFDGAGDPALLPIVVSDAVAGVACIAIGLAWAAKRIPRHRGDDALVALTVLAVVPNVLSVLTRHSLGLPNAGVTAFLTLVPLAMGALIASRRHYAAVAAFTVAAFGIEEAVLGVFDPIQISSLVVSLIGGWVVQGAFLAFARARAEAEAVRREAAEQKARAEHLATLGTLVGSLSHEINSPLMVMGGNADVSRMAIEALLADPGLDPARRESLQEVVRSLLTIERSAGEVEAVMRALRLLSEIPESSRVGDVHDILKDALVLAQTRVPPNVEVVLDPGPATPVRIDPRDLFQVVLVLLADAGAACGRQGGRILVRARPDADDVVVTVEDGSARAPAGADAPALSLERAASLARTAGGVLSVERLTAGGTLRALRVPGGGARGAPT